MEKFRDLTMGIIYQDVIFWALNIVLVLVIYIVGRWVIDLIVKAVDRIQKHSGCDELLRYFTGIIINSVLTVVIVIAILKQLGLDNALIVAAFAVIVVVFGMVLKNFLSDFSAGVMLIFPRSFSVGDVISVTGLTGEVGSIRILNTLLPTSDNQLITVPNSHIYGASIINITGQDVRRIDLVVGINYGDNIERSKKLLEDIVASNNAILKDYVTRIMVQDLGVNSIELAFRPWVKTTDYWVVRSELLQSIKEVFEEQCISISPLQRELSLASLNAFEKVA